MDGFKLYIYRSIITIENTYPPDNLISSYRDFIKHRDILTYYSLNIKVLNSLVELTYKVWFEKKRIARMSLIKLIRRYGKIYLEKMKEPTFKNPIDALPLKSKSELFKIFISLSENSILSKRSTIEAQFLFNKIFFKVSLGEYEESYLCANHHRHELLLNRLLRYPVKSKIISQWARDNYENDTLRIRRAEMTGWLIDEDINFKVPYQTLIDDFEYLNNVDLKSINEFITEESAKKFVKEVSQGIFNVFQERYNYPDFDNDKEFDENKENELKLSRRFYYMDGNIPIAEDTFIPDFDKSRKKFHAEIEEIRTTLMITAISYTRLQSEVKTELLKKYYSRATKHRIYHICIKLQLVDCLKWMLKEES